MLENLHGERILVTGGMGFLGRQVVGILQEHGARVISISRRTGYDLTREGDVANALLKYQPDVVIHCAGKVGGIIANMNSPGSFFAENMRMGLNVVHACALARARLVMIGTICSYPKDVPVPFKEEDLWSGYPEPTNAPYGVAKRALLVMCQAYKKEFGLRFGYLAPTNLYGPGDDFDIENSHVIPALIRKFIEAQEKNLSEVTLLGTGKVTRSFLYVTDAAQAIAMAAESLDYPDIINLPGSPEISMTDLAATIGRLVGYTGSIVWDTTKPDGQPRRFVDGTRAKKYLGWQPTTQLEDGLIRVIEWYRRSRKEDP